MSHLLIEEGHTQRGPAEGFEDAQRRNHLRRSRTVSASSNCIPSIAKELHTLFALPLNPTNVPRRVYRFCEADSDTERSEYGAPMTSKRASWKECQPRPLSKKQCLVQVCQFNIPRDSAELGVPARGRWSPLMVGSTEGAARIWMHLACLCARGTTRVQDRARTPRWRAGLIVPEERPRRKTDDRLVLKDSTSDLELAREIKPGNCGAEDRGWCGERRYTTPAFDCDIAL